MIVIAIIGILAAVAIPQYQDYTLRTEATNSLAAARPLQLAVGEYAARFSQLPANAAAINTYSGVSVTAASWAAGNVASIAVGASGVLTVTMDSTANGVPQDIAGDTFIMTPTETNGIVTWSVTGGTMEAKYRPKVTGN